VRAKPTGILRFRSFAELRDNNIYIVIKVLGAFFKRKGLSCEISRSQPFSAHLPIVAQIAPNLIDLPGSSAMLLADHQQRKTQFQNGWKED
jgi:hypothetical protein